ncbi:MAG: YhjD/YihY/BrkB family envelope integrity protein [Haloferacaceae archaeon]
MSRVTARRSAGVARRIVREMRTGEVGTFAAAVAYYAFVSVVPLLALALVAAGAVGGRALEAVVTDLAGRYLLPTGRAAVGEALRGARGRAGTTVLGTAALAWSGLRLFRGVDVAFARIYGTATGGRLSAVRDGAVALVSVGVGAAAVAAAAGALGTLAGRSPLAGLVPLLSLPVLGGVLFPLYYLVPDAAVSPREALPGTAVAAAGWALLGAGFGAYAAYAASEGSVAVYGVLGGLVLLVTWFYLAGYVLLAGAVTNAVLGGHLGPDRQVQQPRGRGHPTMDREGTDDADAGAGGDGSPDPGDGTPAADRADGADAGAEPAAGADRPGDGATGSREGGPDPAELDARIDALRADLDAFRADVEERTLHREEVKADLKRYVRRRIRRGHARGWGPYLVLLYGTVMTLGAFHFLEGVWAVLAMIVLFLSTLGLYVLFVVVGLGLSLLGTPRAAYERVREFRK